VQTLADGKVWISVADDGPGIPDEEKPKVSTRFYRGDASRGTPGVGLGLTLVASVAKVHGGALELADNWSRGSGDVPSGDNPGLRANMVIPAQAAGMPAVAGQSTATGPSEVAVPSGAAAAAHNLRIRSVS
jgi:signal transduction histidine kinase